MYVTDDGTRLVGTNQNGDAIKALKMKLKRGALQESDDKVVPVFKEKLEEEFKRAEDYKKQFIDGLKDYIE